MYIFTIFQSLRVIFFHFGLKNCYRVSEYEFYSGQFNHLKNKSKENKTKQKTKQNKTKQNKTKIKTKTNKQKKTKPKNKTKQTNKKQKQKQKQNKTKQNKKKQIRTSNSLRNFYNFFTLSEAILLLVLKDQRVYVHTCSYQPVGSGGFFGRAEDLFYHVNTNTSKNGTPHRTSTWPHECSLVACPQLQSTFSTVFHRYIISRKDLTS